jgi:DinB superfamily
MSVADGSWVVPGPGWVCPECGFDFDATDPRGAADLVREFPARYRVPLERSLPGEDLDALVRARPAEGSWSALEYACHTRDTFTLYERRIAVTLDKDRPVFSRMHRDQLAIDDDYNRQHPAYVVDSLAESATSLARALDAIPPDGWARVGVREDLPMTIDWMARNVVHEGRHHLLDIGRALRAARRAATTAT